MHETSYATMGLFVEVHLDAFRGTPLEILDFGSQTVDDQALGSYRPLFDNPGWNYRGLDIVAGANVDIVVADAYDWREVPGDSVDLVISGQALEHVEYPWASLFEIVRVLAPGGVAALIAPSGGFEHRYPLDCWRFYTDGFAAVGRYAGGEIVDVFTDWNHGEWDDSVLVLRKPEWDAEGRAAFAHRAALQRELLGSSGRVHESAGGEPSPLRAIVPGALTKAFEQARDARLAAEAVAAEQAAVDAAAAHDAELHDAVNAHLNRIAPIRWYGQARGLVAQAVGDRGRASYKRLRGRS